MKTKLLTVLLCWGVFLWAQPQDVSVVFKQPAKHFTESLPIGNGRLGAMLFGKTDTDRIVLNEISLWSGGYQEADDPEAHTYLKEIEAYLSVGLKPAEIARRLGRNHSTIIREINRGSVTQVKQVNGQKVYYQHYYADGAHNRYHHARETSYYLKLDRVLDDFLREFIEAMREKPRLHSVDTFVHT